MKSKTPKQQPSLLKNPNPISTEEHHPQEEQEIIVLSDRDQPEGEADRGGEVEGEEEGEEGEEEGEDGGGDGEDENKPKLAEGYFEIEDFRRKRTRRGQVQYLVKWRGWPESSNTWEPEDNLTTCKDIIKAFEDRNVGKYKPGRKRKRKYSISSVQPKNKQLRVSNESGDKDGGPSSDFLTSASIDNSIQSVSTSNHMIESSNTSEIKDFADEGMKHVSIINHSTSVKDGDPKNCKTVDIVEELVGSGSKTILLKEVDPRPDNNVGFIEDGLTTGDLKEGSPRVVKDTEIVGKLNVNGLKDSALRNVKSKEAHEVPPVLGEHISSGYVNNENISPPHSETLTPCRDDPTNGHPPIKCAEPVQNNCSKGSKRRKSGSVRRVKNDYAPSEPERAQNGGANSISIVEIIKPTSLYTSITNNVHEVSVKFLAMCSDGKEVEVDNKFLKANDPLLLINFYEKCLRYAPPK